MLLRLLLLLFLLLLLLPLQSLTHLFSVRSSVPARFRVKTNRPSRLSSRPCAGDLPPHSSAAVAITVSPFDYREEEGRSDEVEGNNRKRKSSTAGAAFLLMVYASEKGENVERAEKDQVVA